MAHLRFTFVPPDIFDYFFWDVQYMSHRSNAVWFTCRICSALHIRLVSSYTAIEELLRSSAQRSLAVPEMSGVAFLRLRLQSLSKITESYSNPAPVYVKNQNSNSCFHSCYSKNFCKVCNHNVIQTLGLC